MNEITVFGEHEPNTLAQLQDVIRAATVKLDAATVAQLDAASAQ